MNNELVKYTSTSFAMKLNNDYDIKELNNRLTFSENRQQGNSKLVSDIRDNICDIYSICELLQGTLKTTSNKMNKLNHMVETLINKCDDLENRIQKVEDDYIELNEFMQKFVDD